MNIQNRAFQDWQQYIFREHDNNQPQPLRDDRFRIFQQFWALFNAYAHRLPPQNIVQGQDPRLALWHRFLYDNASWYFDNYVRQYTVNNNNLGWSIDLNVRQFADINTIDHKIFRLHQITVEQALRQEYGNNYTHWLQIHLDGYMKRELLGLVRYFKYRRNNFNEIIGGNINNHILQMLFGPITLDRIGDLYDDQFVAPSKTEVLQLYLRRTPRYRGDDGMDVLPVGSGLNFNGSRFGVWLQEVRNYTQRVALDVNNPLFFGNDLYALMCWSDPFSVLFALQRAYYILRSAYPHRFRQYTWNQIIRNDNMYRGDDDLDTAKDRIYNLTFHILQWLKEFCELDNDILYRILRQVDFHSYSTDRIRNRLPPLTPQERADIIQGLVARGIQPDANGDFPNHLIRRAQVQGRISFYNHNFTHIFPYYIGRVDIDDTRNANRPAGAEDNTHYGTRVINNLLHNYFTHLNRITNNDFELCHLIFTFRGYFEDENIPIKVFQVKLQVTKQNLNDMLNQQEGMRLLWERIEERVAEINEENEGHYEDDRRINLDEYLIIRFSFFLKTRHNNDTGAIDFNQARGFNINAFCRGIPGCLTSMMIKPHVTFGICLYEAMFHILYFTQLHNDPDLKRITQEDLKDVIYTKFHQEPFELQEFVLNGSTIEILKWLEEKYNIVVNLLLWERKDLSFVDYSVERPKYFAFTRERKFTLVLKRCHCYAIITEDIYKYLCRNKYFAKVDLGSFCREDLRREKKQVEKDRKFIMKASAGGSKKDFSGDNDDFNEDWAYDFETFAEPLPHSEKNSERKLHKMSKHIPYLIYVVNVNNMNQEFHFEGLNCVQDFLQWIYQKVSVDEINSKQKKKIKRVNMWSFNGHKFDLLFLLDDLIRRYQVNLIGSITDVKYFTCFNLRFFDFYKIFPMGSLEKQALAWDVEFKKGYFDHASVNVNNLSDIMEKAKEYCYDDCRALCGLITKFKDFCNSTLGISCYQTSCSAMAMDYFRTNYLKDNVITGIPFKFFPEFRKGYFGGMTLMFKKKSHNECLYYYDINSSYPASMRDADVPYTYYDCKTEFITLDHIKENKIQLQPQNFYNVRSFRFKPDIKYPFFPEKNEKGELFYRLESREPCGRWGQELIKAIDLNLLDELEIDKTFIFCLMKRNKKRLFYEFVESIFNMRLQAKREGNVIKEQTLKLILNNLYGKFGQRMFPSSEFCNYEQLSYLIKINNGYEGSWDEMRIITDINQLGDNIYEVTFDESNYGISSCVHLASFITSCSRLRLVDAIYSLTKNGREMNVLYCDTDSIVTEERLSAGFIDNYELGKFKLECIIPNSSFIWEMYRMEKEQDITNEIQDDKKKLFTPKEGFLVNGAKFYFMMSLNQVPKGKGNISCKSCLHQFGTEYFPDYNREQEFLLEPTLKIKGINKKCLYEDIPGTYQYFVDFLEGKCIHFDTTQFQKDSKQPGCIYNVNVKKQLDPSRNHKRKQLDDGTFGTIPFL